MAAGDPVAQALRGAADYGQRPVGVQQDRAENGEQDEPGDAEQGGVGQSRADRRAGQDGRQRDDGQREQATDAEQGKAVRAPTAVSVSNPAVVSMLNWRAAPAASPPGRLLVTALPASPAVTTANQPRVRSASRWKAKLQVKEASSAATATLNQTGLSVDRRGHEPSTAASLGKTR